MKMTNNTQIKHSNLSYPINIHDGPCKSYSDILDKGIKQLIMVLNKHCKVLATRLDFHMPEHTKLNTNIRLFVDYLKRYIQRTYSTKTSRLNRL